MWGWWWWWGRDRDRRGGGGSFVHEVVAWWCSWSWMKGLFLSVSFKYFRVWILACDH